MNQIVFVIICNHYVVDNDNIFNQQKSSTQMVKRFIWIYLEIKV